MAQNVIINSVTYQNVPEVDIPKSGGGTAKFYYVPTDGAFYADAACTNAITAITMPTKSAALSLG